MSIPRVIWSVTPDQTQSPYIRDIALSLEANGWTVQPLTLQTIARTSQQVVHIQWPEHVSRGASTAATVAKHVRAVGVLAALRVRKHAVVLTAHNQAPHGKSDPFDAWFRRSVQRHAAAVVLLVPGHRDPLTHDGAINKDSVVQVILHPTHNPDTPLELLPQAERTQLVVLGQIHPYHQIEEFLDALDAQGNSRPVLVVGGVGDDAMLARLTDSLSRRPWLSIRPGFADDATLEPILSRSAAIVSLQRNTFNSGGPFYALPRGLPIIMSNGPQATDIANRVGDGWVFSVPENVAALDLAELDKWVDGERGAPTLEDFDVERIAAQHIELYELLQS